MPPERTDMKKSRTRKKIQTMHDWLMTPVGQYILGWEENHFQTLSADIFGFNAVQIGFPEINTLQENRMTNRWYTHPFMPESEIRRMQETGHFSEPDSDSVRISLVHDIDELPFASESVDLIVLPHAFEFARSPHQILREVDRVLIPEGQVIISGFNPASLWGIRQHFQPVVRQPFFAGICRVFEPVPPERLAETAELRNQPRLFRLLPSSLPYPSLAEAVHVHGESRQPVVALSWVPSTLSAPSSGYTAFV